MPAQSTQTGGALDAAFTVIRRRVDEPTARAKYPDNVLLDMLNEAWQEVLPDLYNQADNPPLARFSITLVPGQNYYTLPCTVGEIWWIAKRDTQGRIEWEIVPDNRLNPLGPGVMFEGNQRVWIDRDYCTDGQTIELLYIPSGDCYMASGTVIPTAGSTTTLTLLGAGSTITLGGVDRRPNAYIGGLLSIYKFDGSNPSGYAQFPIQQRIISAYNVATGVVTVEPAFDFDISTLTPSNSALYWEIYPIEATCVWPVLTRHVARQILQDEGKDKKYRLMTASYQEAKRACSLRWSSLQTRVSSTLGQRTVNNSEYTWGIGE